jgi:hypothetical protein
MPEFRLPSLALATLVLALPFAAGGQTPSQGTPGAVVGSIASSDISTVRGRVIAVNPKTRAITLRGPEGNTLQVVASDEIKNIDRIKKGEDVVLRFRRSVALILTRPGEPLPDMSVSESSSRNPAGGEPGGTAVRHVTVTGNVVAIDMATHTISLVPPSGGAVRTIAVTDPQRQEQMSHINIGDRLTAVFTEAVAISLEPAQKS